MKIIYPNQFEVEVQLLHETQLNELLKVNNGKIHESLSKELTARTYSISSDQIIIEFYDKSGVLLKGEKDFNNLKRVRFIKNKVDFLKPRISYYIRLSEKEADDLINQLDGKHLTKYKAEFEEYFGFKVFQLSNGQVIIRYKDESTLYENLHALAFDNREVLNIHYPNGYESGKEEFINGILPIQFNVNNYIVYPNDAEKIIKTHELIKIKENIKFDNNFKSILYNSPKGYLILISDFEQLNVAGTAKIGIGTAHIFYTMESFTNEYEKKLNWRNEYEANPELRRGVHIYKDLSEKYGRDYPNHTMEELKKLPAILNFDSTYLKFDKTCISILSESIKWNYGGDEFLNQIIHPILSYIGEYYKSKKRGDWNMKLDGEGKVWEPWFVNSEGKELFDIINLYKDFHEAEYGIPMVEFYIQ
ncbi:hypothetical protein [Flammeovirga sp. SJP92]|uniref:hypothetical protein n=1 Tax=Flammeovirga sp. SJP92 TaxID=1775430 RepID=UPI0007870AF0|nr:hypothetical protein [Flammeovirga sp. SJP92]KXX69936.1 hypothetical protein AVL50_13750 [Flammeovirga sp. SJP92]